MEPDEDTDQAWWSDSPTLRELIDKEPSGPRDHAVPEAAVLELATLVRITLAAEGGGTIAGMERAASTSLARSRVMAAVRQRGTAPERVVRRLLTALGVRYRLNVRMLPGTPDIVNQRRRLVVFVHGCFWHRHPGCSRATTPRRNRRFWTEKFVANIQRDRRSLMALRRLGFSVVIVWECETRDEARLVARLRDLVSRGVGRNFGGRILA